MLNQGTEFSSPAAQDSSAPTSPARSPHRDCEVRVLDDLSTGGANGSTALDGIELLQADVRNPGRGRIARMHGATR